MDWSWIAVLCIVMLLTGILGGIVSYYFNTKKEKFDTKDLWRPIILGVGAAFSVPLFLRILSNNLIETANANNGNLLVFGSYCLVAAIFSKPFLTALSNQEIRNFKEQVENVEKMAIKAEGKANDATEKANDANSKAEEAKETAKKAHGKAETLTKQVDDHTVLINKNMGKG